MSSKLNIDNILSQFNIFLTGASGFVGSVILQTLLALENETSNKDHNQIFLLLRNSRKHGSIEQRLRNEILSQSIFEMDKDMIEDLLITNKKIIAVEGDLTKPNLGLHEKDLNRLKYPSNEKPVLVLHCAADVDFDREINESININVNGTFQCIQVAKQINAKGFLHISTLYVNTREQTDARIMERMYDSGFDSVSVFNRWLDSNKQFNAEQVNSLLKSKCPSHAILQKDWPNHYTLTKNIAENVALQTCNKYEIPMSIARLGIVSPIRKGKHKGWFMGSGGFVFIAIGEATGNIKYLQGDGKGRPDFIPVDYTVNTLIAILARMGHDYLKTCEAARHNNSNNCDNSDFDPVENGTIYQVGVVAIDKGWNIKQLTDYVVPNWHLRNLPESPKDAGARFIKSAVLFFLIELVLYDIPLFFVWILINILTVCTKLFWYDVWYKFFGLKYYPQLYSLKLYSKTGKQQDSFVSVTQIRSIQMQLLQSSNAYLRKLQFMLNARAKLKWFHTNYSFFVNQKWIFDHTNVKELFASLCRESQYKYDFDIESFDFHAYCLDVAILCYLKWLEFRKTRKLQHKQHRIVLEKKLLELKQTAKSEFSAKFPSQEQQFIWSFRGLWIFTLIGYQWFLALAVTALFGLYIYLYV